MGELALGTPNDAGEKRVTWAELLFDLVFVFAVTQVSGLLHHEHSAAGLAQAAIVLVPVYWAWVGTAIHANTHDVDVPRERLGVFAVGAAGLLMALAIPEAYGERGLLYGAAYLVLRVILAGLVFRGIHGIPVNSFSAGVCVTGPLLLVGGLVDGWPRTALWAVAAAVDLSVPWLVRRRLAGIQFEPAHLPERFGLFIIIALGESVVAVGLAASDGTLTTLRIVTVVLAYALTCAMWWVYFAFAASAVRHALETAVAHTEVTRSVLAYGHLLFVAGIIAVAVGLGEAVRHPGAHLPGRTAGLLVGGVVVYLATFGYTRWRMFRAVSSTRLGAALACVVLAPLALVVPGIVAVCGLAALVTALNITEAVLVRRAPTAKPETIEH